MTATETTTDRTAFIGASEVAAILGLDSYRSPLRVYQEKVGEAEPFAGNDLTALGNEFEDGVARLWARRSNATVEPDGTEYVHPRLPFFRGHIDRKIVAPFDGGLEVKCSSAMEWGDEGTDQIPSKFVPQVQSYMLLTGRQEWHVAALLWGNYGPPSLRGYVVQRSAEFCEFIEHEVGRFWADHVEARNPPDPRDAQEAAARFRDVVDGATVTATETGMAKIAAFAHAKAEADRYGKMAETLKVDLMISIGTATGMVDADGELLATWKPHTRRSLNRKKAEELLGDNFPLALDETEVRPFTLKKAAKALAREASDV